MTTFRNTIKRSLLTLAVVGLGLASTARSASADIVFAVDDSVVPGSAAYCALATSDCQFDADKINGFYTETLTINGDFSFDASALAFFTAYVLGGGSTGDGLNNCAEGLNAACYDLYAVFSGDGNVDPVTGEVTFDNAQVTLFVDPSQDNTYTDAVNGSSAWGTVDASNDDEEVLSSVTLVTGTGELVPPTGGFFDLIFGNIDLTAFGEMYFPDLDTLNLSAVVDGDFDQVPSPPVPGTYTGVRGDLSVVYDIAQVPEPATLSLLGLGLAAAGAAARRRRSNNA